ncbi:glucosaminidase domain-containing protein [Paraglaciecola psychrophila]|uniref:Lysozyme n=1 Tax=Paraglaciecola psychrophila 170 TaxID=1129794 RepID=K6ZK29_9ALTE|nr:glucosaminidase domain-containing protein [Paraglaciecola psychrophila]AGH44948.1 lysozyme [Paraglaciecola psychrophila 170]GAC36301.1 Bax protein [Paraglaciecola psychrophila 170]
MRDFIKISVVTLAVVISTIVFIVLLQQFKTKDVAEDIISLNGLHIAPLDSSRKAVPNFSDYADVIEKKQAFFAYLQPEIQRQNEIVLKEREMVIALQALFLKQQEFNKHQKAVFKKLAKKYQFSSDKSLSVEQTLETLVRRVDTIPEALILVQAANESGWGESRFAQKGYNFFGLWCFKKGCGFVPKQRTDGAEHEVARFRDLSHAVMTYVRNINRHYAYKDLRVIRQILREADKPVTARALAVGLSSYSERGQEYIDELLSMLRVNRKHMETES